MPATHAPGDSQAQGNRPSPGRAEGQNQQGQKRNGRGEKRREKNSRAKDSSPGSRHGHHSWRAKCRQEPISGPAYQRHARGRSISVYDHHARPGHDALGRRYRPTDRYSADHGRFHGSESARTDSSGRFGAADGRSGQRRRHRTVPGCFRSPFAHENPAGRQIVPGRRRCGTIVHARHF